MSGESALDKAAVKAAVESNGLKLASAELQTRQKAQRELRYDFTTPST